LAADQGDALAQYRIALLYENGWGVQRDGNQARDWMVKAAAGNNDEAKKWLAAIPSSEAQQLFISAAVNWSHGEAQFLLNNGTYVRFDKVAHRLDDGYPKPIDNQTWPGLAPYAQLIVAACDGPSGKAYFFLSDGRYIQYDISADRADDGYPKPMDDKTWPGMGRYGAMLSSALNWKDNKIQFFLSDGTYIRYDLIIGRADLGYPQDISDKTWPGLEPYRNKLGGMINFNTNKAFMFLKDGTYISYDMDKDRVDSGYPKPFDESWTGLISLFIKRRT